MPEPVFGLVWFFFQNLNMQKEKELLLSWWWVSQLFGEEGVEERSWFCWRCFSVVRTAILITCIWDWRSWLPPACCPFLSAPGSSGFAASQTSSTWTLAGLWESVNLVWHKGRLTSTSTAELLIPLYIGMVFSSCLSEEHKFSFPWRRTTK